MSNYLELCQKFQRVTGITGSEIASVVSQTGMNLKILTWIADADIDTQNLWQDWKFLDDYNQIITTAALTDEYTLASLAITDHITWDKKKFFINPGAANYRKLNFMEYDEWLESRERLGVKLNNEPRKFTILPNNSIVFMDRPDDAFTIWARYFIAPTRMSANSDESAIPATYEMVIVHRAKMYYAEFYEHWDMYESAEKDYLKELMKLEAAQLPGQETRTRSANDPEDNRIVTE